jgi:chorismate mutase
MARDVSVNHNEEDRIEMAKEIAEVRRTGETNMFDRTRVAELLEEMGFEYTAEYIRANVGDYGSLLELSGKY